LGVDHGACGAAGVCDGCPVTDHFDGAALLIIDPQNDFHPPNGSLGVPGAVEDTQRIVELIEKHGHSIGRIIVTLDTHHQMHIAHGGFWEDATGNSPAPFTIITSDEIKAGKWKARQPELREWSLEYAKKLESGGRFKVCIWPEHCLLGSPGHAVWAPLAEALQKWAFKRLRNVTWLLKGQNNRTEMYSALKAEVECDGDPAASLNTTLIETLANHQKVLCCGEAKSHCVNYTVRDLLSGWPKHRKQDIVLLSDACSSVPGFTEIGDQFEKDMKTEGVTVCKASEWTPPVPPAAGWTFNRFFACRSCC
jgi:nicotinamidase-related amidase